MYNQQPIRKRQYRELSDSVKTKISASTRNKAKSEQHKEHIRQGMLRYWGTVPSKEEGQWNDTVNDQDNENKI